MENNISISSVDFNTAEYGNNSLKQMPELLSYTILTLKSQFKGCSINSITNIVLAKTAQMLTSKRIQYKELENIGFPNQFSIVFMPSGFGKDKMTDDLDKHFFHEFRIWFKDKAKSAKEKQYEQIKLDAESKFVGDKQESKRQNYIEEECKKVRNIILEVSDGTREGFFSDAKAFQDADFGSVFMKNSELGTYLTNAKHEQKQFLNQLFEAYNGKIISKCIKGGYREPDIENLPVNALLYSDPTLFESDLKKPFHALMQTGLGRRSVITFMHKKEKYEPEQDSQKALLAEHVYYRNLKELGSQLFRVFLSVDKNAQYELTQETYHNVFHPYKIANDKSADAQDNELLKKEITSHQLKALKLSCLYACINHPSDLFIHPIDMEQAISTIEMLSIDFKAFLKHKPKYRDKYDLVFDFFLENEGKEFNKTQLQHDHYQKFGCSRDKFIADFTECINIVRELAATKGYFLNERPINRNSGTAYSLIRLESKDLGNNIVPLDTLVNSTD